jgi:hypothetical protein
LEQDRGDQHDAEDREQDLPANVLAQSGISLAIESTRMGAQPPGGCYAPWHSGNRTAPIRWYRQGRAPTAPTMAGPAQLELDERAVS